MAGDFVHSVNNIFDKADQSNITAAVVFNEILSYIDSHGHMDFAGYGTGSSQTGTTPPSGWINWDYTTDPPPFGDNSWFIVNATSASASMNGTGDQQWQMKIQTTLSSGFDDPSGNDYGYEGNTYTTCIRASSEGGWSSSTLDFAPTSGSEASDNYRVYAGQNESVRIDVVGDNDTIFWRGNAGDSVNHYYTRQCYIGMLTRRFSDVANPFFMMCGCIYDGYSNTIADLRKNSAYAADGYRQWAPERVFKWPTYSISVKDGIRRLTGSNDNYYAKRYPSEYGRTTYYPYSSTPTGGSLSGMERIWHKIPVRQNRPPADFSVLGEMNLLVDTDTSEVYNAYDAGPYIQIVPDYATYGGVGMRYPSAVEVPATLW